MTNDRSAAREFGVPKHSELEPDRHLSRIHAPIARQRRLRSMIRPLIGQCVPESSLPSVIGTLASARAPRLE